MEPPDPHDSQACLRYVRHLVEARQVQVSRHAQVEMDEEYFVVHDALMALGNGQVLENYPEHRRGPCCLIGGTANDERPLHVVCTTVRRPLIIITVYEPKPPQWTTPETRER